MISQRLRASVYYIQLIVGLDSRKDQILLVDLLLHQNQNTLHANSSQYFVVKIVL